MNFLGIPPEVIEGHILSFLAWNDLLRFRRVCKLTKTVVAGYMKVNPELAPEIEIDLDNKDKTSGAFLQMGIGTTKLFLNNSCGDSFYDRDLKEQAKFLKKYGKMIKHLRVVGFSLYCCGKEWDFFDALVNLESFEADHFSVGRAFTGPEDLQRACQEKLARAKQEPRSINKVVPDVITRLKSVKIGQQPGVVIGNITNRTGGFLEKCPGLEYVSMPYNSHMGTTSTFTLPQDHNPLYTMAWAFIFIEKCVKDRAAEGRPNLKCFDFECYHDEFGFEAMQNDFNASRVFLELMPLFIKHNVTVKNINPIWFAQRNHLPQFSDPNLGIPVLSMVGLHPCVLPVNMPNLERVEIQATSRSSPGANWRRDRPHWPSLKSLEITVDCKQTQCSEWDQEQRNSVFYVDTKVMFNFFFQDIRHTNLTELCLLFAKDAGEVAVPKTDDIVSACPNLKKLKLFNWPGTNKSLTKLWSGLLALEEISLEYCKDLGNVAFVGEDVRSPVFLKLTKLKKLSLKGLDRMPKISDTLFNLILRHLKLTHLTLTSEQPIHSITSAGILALLEGPFATSIEKFSFQGWSLDNVPTENFKKLERKFRSSDML